jgi:hypothetical protein
VLEEQSRLRAEPAHMTRRLDVRYPGLFTLLGYDMPRTSFRPGERIRIVFYYRVDAETQRNLFFNVFFQGPTGYPIPPHFHADHYPLNGRYFTYMWRAGEVLRDECEIVIPADIRHPVQLDFGLAVLDGPQRVPFDGDARGDRLLPLTQVTIR